MDIQVTETNRGKKCIIVDGHRCITDITLKYGDISWRCVTKRCKSHLRTATDIQLVLEGKNVHSHMPYDIQVEKHILRVNTKRKAVDDMNIE